MKPSRSNVVRRNAHVFWSHDDLVTLVMHIGGADCVVPMLGVDRRTRTIAKTLPLDRKALLTPPLDLYKKASFSVRDVVQLRLGQLYIDEEEGGPTIEGNPSLLIPRLDWVLKSSNFQASDRLYRMALRLKVQEPDGVTKMRLAWRLHLPVTAIDKLGLFPSGGSFTGTKFYDQPTCVPTIVAYTDGLWGLLARRARIERGQRAQTKYTWPPEHHAGIQELSALMRSSPVLRNMPAANKTAIMQAAYSANGLSSFPKQQVRKTHEDREHLDIERDQLLKLVATVQQQTP